MADGRHFGLNSGCSTLVSLFITWVWLDRAQVQYSLLKVTVAFGNGNWNAKSYVVFSLQM